MRYFPPPPNFAAWQPSTWPPPPAKWDDEFGRLLKAIFSETILDEISNVVEDAKKVNGSLVHRGYVVAIGLLCAIDAIASYAYPGKVGRRYRRFIKEHFPVDYRPNASALYDLYRNSLVHSWHLFQAAMYPGTEPIKKDKEGVSFGLLNLFAALKSGVDVDDLFARLQNEPKLQTSVLRRYSELKKSAKP